MINSTVTYDLDAEQLEMYENGQPMVLLVPVHPSFFPLGDALKLLNDVSQKLPDIAPSDIDDCRPGYIWCEPSTVPPLQRTSLSDIYGKTMSPSLAKECPFVVSLWVAVVSVNDGRANRVCGVFPEGAIRQDEEIFFPMVEHDVERLRKTSRPAVNPEYFVQTDFGKPE